MKIVRVYPNFQTDFKYTEHYLAQELAELGHFTTFVSSGKYLPAWKKYMTNYEGLGKFNHQSFDVIRLSTLNIFGKLFFVNIKILKNIIFKSDYNIIHLYGIGNLTTIQVLIISLFIRGKIPPIIISDHTTPFTSKRKGLIANFYFFIVKVIVFFLKNRINKVITFSSVGIDILSKRYGIDRDLFLPIPLGYNDDVFNYDCKLKNKNPKFVLGYAGKLNKQKRIDFLINILTELDFKSEIKLIVLGYIEKDAYCQKLKEMASQTQLDIEFRAFAEETKLAEFYNYIDLAIFPGSISITTLEANGCGVPIILFNSIKELESRVEDQRGILFKSKVEFKNAIRIYYDKYKNNTIDCHMISKNTEEKYAWGVIMKSYLLVYNNLLEK